MGNPGGSSCEDENGKRMTERPLMIELSVKLSNGQFESTITLPITATEDEMGRLARAWLELMTSALKIGRPE